MKKYHKKRIYGTALFCLFSLAGCGGGGGTNLLPLAFGSLLTPTVDYTEILEYSANNVITPSLDDLETNTLALKNAADTYNSSKSSGDLPSLQTAWRNARASLKKAEVFYFGPADLPNSKSYYTKMDGFEKAGARPSWSAVSQVIANTATAPSCPAATITSTALQSCAYKYKGFEALEMLIFSADGAHPETVADNTSIHNANTATPRRFDYIQALAELIHQDALALQTEWSVSGGNFKGNFINGTGTYFRNQGEAFDKYVQSIGNVSYQMEDVKIAAPACLNKSCTTGLNTSNPVLSEAIYARNAYKDLYNNLLSLEFAYLGNISDPDNKSLSLMVAAQNPGMDTNIKSAITDLKNSLTSKIGAPKDLYAEIALDGGTVGSGSNVESQVKPLWQLALTLKTYLTIYAFSVLGVPNLPSPNDGD
ncbi:imelysin [Leptospira wolffii]|uniref:imelysin family protein n=1 Tax=Leptospira wolffii TaxID=409998 RepID=UPI001082E661|nr:imelysin family protein [Leptospira wolffii]TGK58186.1 imelysin [Leptospira wolffii]TGK67404.1 imelysin [Leptospira wolffii]TGK68864.1 imelysin [Leptospira wolffii]TGL27216.1 imelysin [Leptospira wolffii]